MNLYIGLFLIYIGGYVFARNGFVFAYRINLLNTKKMDKYNELPGYMTMLLCQPFTWIYNTETNTKTEN